MFTPLGCFSEIKCPRDKECTLLKCLFSHPDQTPEANLQNPVSADTGPPAKRLKMDKGSAGTFISPAKPLEMGRRVSAPLGLELSAAAPSTAAPDSKKPQPSIQGNAKPPILKSVGASESSAKEPPKSQGTSQVPQLPPRQAPKESLNPRMLKSAPASHASRTVIVNKIHASIKALNEKLSKDKNSSNRCFILTPDEIITMALDEEEKHATENPTVYTNLVRLRIVKLIKMSVEEWIKQVMAHLNERYYKINPIVEQPILKPTPDPKANFPDLTLSEQLVLVSRLITPLTGLEKHGYVTKAPTPTEIEVARKGVDESKGWEKCDRCGQRFQVFPGRRHDGLLTTGGQCTYHPSRPIHARRKRTDHVTGGAQPTFPCCNESISSSVGCTKADTHVYKVSEAKRLASTLQFKTTPAQPGKGPLEPVSIDCEMGYTTLGMELIRLTAISWPEGGDLLDVLVRPTGEVLDLNTRFSGVTPQDYASAKPYDTSSASNPSADEKGKSKSQFQIVKSVEAARELLMSFLQPETPLIGHAIDNDLNVCRLIHPTVIDTVLLFPHPKGLPVRWSLKILAERHLGRHIQTGDNGHDSKEDSVATGDLVRVKLGTRWNALKKKGWQIKNGKLFHPGHRLDQPSHGNSD